MNKSLIFSNKLKFNFLMAYIIILILIPRVPISIIESSESVFRVDNFLAIILGVISLTQLKTFKSIFFAFIVFILFVQIGDYSKSSALYFQFMGILLIPTVLLSNKFFKDNSSIKLIENYFDIVLIFIIFNIFFSIFSRFFNFNFCISQDLSIGCIGEYGLLDRPYIYAIYSGVGFVYGILKNFKKNILSLFIIAITGYGLFLSDSRSISLVFFIFGVLFFLIYKCNSKMKKLITIIVFIVVVFTILNQDNQKISIRNIDIISDSSWSMRFENINRYIEWLDFRKLLIGNGAQSFLNFSTQYDRPGPLDILYVRLLSEIGLLGLIISAWFMFKPLIKSTILIYKFFLMGLLPVLLFSVYQESLVVPKTGHLIMLYLVFLVIYFKVNNERKFKHSSNINSTL